MLLKPIINNINLIYDNKDFSPKIYTEKDFANINVSESVKKRAIVASVMFKEKADNKSLFPAMSYSLERIDENEKLLVHNYTGACPIETFEVNPVIGCNVGCLYCLVDDGIHQEIIAYENYADLLLRRLEENRFKNHFFYFSPKTEAFCEATLQTGIAHKILLAFIKHFEIYPDSKARLFIASKAGVKALQYAFEGNRIIDLFVRLKDKMQYNISISILPENCRTLIEPYADSIENRLKAARLCQDNGITSNSALVQPILVNMLSDKMLDEFFDKLKDNGIVNIKPEFLTASVENMVMLCQVLELYDKDILKKIFELYYANENLDHVKQRSRIAPSREVSRQWVNIMRKKAQEKGISTSICYWVRTELEINELEIPIINENGYKCLGYQSNLFK